MGNKGAFMIYLIWRIWFTFEKCIILMSHFVAFFPFLQCISRTQCSLDKGARGSSTNCGFDFKMNMHNISFLFFAWHIDSFFSISFVPSCVDYDFTSFYLINSVKLRYSYIIYFTSMSLCLTERTILLSMVYMLIMFFLLAD